MKILTVPWYRTHSNGAEKKGSIACPMIVCASGPEPLAEL